MGEKRSGTLQHEINIRTGELEQYQRGDKLDILLIEHKSVTLIFSPLQTIIRKSAEPTQLDNESSKFNLQLDKPVTYTLPAN
ncbi:hypothetical protein J6590_078569 [Homalodisca vitripennis]|nr:hypothetical protein J6590_078569 [Homalodisca vitripennis]